MRKIRVLLVDDHTIIRIGIRNLLANAPDIEVVGEATNGTEALQLVQELDPDVLILDMEMPGISGIEVAQNLRSQGSRVHILALSAYNDRRYVENVLKSGASGYLVKDEAPDAILDAVRGVAQGEQGWISRQIVNRLVDWSSNPQYGYLLTGREAQVLQELLHGKTNQEIGLALKITDKTVEKHMDSIFQKLGVSSRTEAAVWAAKEELGNRLPSPG
jgi:DNA-binding NarL/FixJ family response regulator